MNTRQNVPLLTTRGKFMYESVGQQGREHIAMGGDEKNTICTSLSEREGNDTPNPASLRGKCQSF